MEYIYYQLSLFESESPKFDEKKTKTHGKIFVLDKDKDKSGKIDINDLLEQARSAGYFDLEEIAFAIMEVNGKISFLAKDMYRQPTKKDLKVKTNNDSLSANIIIDSKLMKENIFNTDRDLDWFISQLKVKGYETYEKILLATYKDNKITIYEKDYSEPNDVLE